ncbi:MAG: FtsL-like putative cell division protein [Paludibacteraceae bacterium]
MANNKINTALQEVLSGNLFTREFFKRQYKLLMLIVVLLFISINNGYKGNAQRQKIRKLQETITEKRYEVLDLSATYTELTRASSISRKLQETNSKVRESTEPPIRIQ